MSNTTTGTRGARNAGAKQSLQSNLSKLIKEARSNEETLDNTLASCAGPILAFPETINELIESNRTEDIPKVQALTKSIRGDLAEFAPKVTQLKSKLERAVNQPAGNVNQMSKKYSDIFTISTGMLHLTETVFETTVKSTTQLGEILEPATPEVQQ